MNVYIFERNVLFQENLEIICVTTKIINLVTPTELDNVTIMSYSVIHHTPTGFDNIISVSLTSENSVLLRCYPFVRPFVTIT